MVNESRPLRESIYNFIIDKLHSGEILPGETLKERKLAKELGVSRTPVREAFLQLEKVGVLTVNQKSGAVIRKLTIEETAEMLDIISVLEAYAVESAVELGIQDEAKEIIQKLGEEMEQYRKERDFFSFPIANREFHDYLVSLAGNITLLDYIRELNTKLYTGGVTVPYYIDQYSSGHEKIIDYILQGMSKEAGAAMKEHNQFIKTKLIETIGKMKTASNPLHYSSYAR